MKPFVITTDDIKLDNGIFPSRIEIEKFDPDSRRTKVYDADEYDEFGQRSEMAPSESDLSQVMRRRDGPGRRIEVFSGVDPIFNCKNLGLRIKRLTRKQVCLLAMLVLVLSLAVSAVLLWFKVVLSFNN